MKNYLCKLSSTVGRRGTTVSREENNETRELLARGVICEIAVAAGTETKAQKAQKKADK